MFILVKGKLKTFNPIMVDRTLAGRKMQKEGAKDHIRNKDGSMKALSGGDKEIKEKGMLKNIWCLPVGGWNTGDEFAGKHPAAFPERLAEMHIISWSNEGDCVFDPFCGSGTTGKMSVLNNRNFVGIEISEEYVNIANERIQHALSVGREEKPNE